MQSTRPLAPARPLAPPPVSGSAALARLALRDHRWMACIVAAHLLLALTLVGQALLLPGARAAALVAGGGLVVAQLVLAACSAHVLRRRTGDDGRHRTQLERSHTALSEHAEATWRSLALVEATLDATADGILVIDGRGRVADYNRRFVEMWRVPETLVAAGDHEALRAHVLDQLVDPETFDATVRLFGQAPERRHVDQIELTGGRVFERSVSPQRLDGRTVGRVLGFHDVTERVRLERELAHQALTDALTGLPNRALFHDRLTHAIARAGRDPGRVGALLVDLDGFRLVNDGLGHGVGDAVLVAVADRLRQAVREGDTVARLGGDEFAVLLEDVRTREEADVAAERVLAVIGTPVRVEGAGEVFVAASVGVAVAAPDDDAGALLRNADVAMYAAKARGRNQYAHFERAVQERALARLQLEADLRAAVLALATADVAACDDAGPMDLRLLYQPIVALGTARCVGAEALLRWHHPERGLVPPLDFIPLAEEMGLIVPLGRWVLAEACRAATAWPAAPGGEAPGVSVNLSGRQLEEASLVDDVRDVLAATRLAPARLTLEITEGVVVRDTAQALARLRALKALGVRIAIDDFGTGCSSLGYLRQFPVDVLKIDKRFVDGVAHGGEAAALARTIVALADSLQLRTVAEGVEAPAQQAALEALGCTLGQGFLFARPMPAAEVARRLAPESDFLKA